MNKFDLTKFKADLSQIRWDDVLTDPDPISAFEKWNTKFIAVFDKHAPFKRKRIRHKDSPWMTNEIVCKMRERDQMKKRAKGSGSEKDWMTYKRLKNDVTAIIRQTKKTYVTESIVNNEGDSNAMWKSLRRILPKKANENSIQKINIDNDVFTESGEIASCLNDHFVDLASKRTRNRIFGDNMNQYMTRVETKFSFEHVKSSDVLKCFNEIARNKATGLDQIPASILKDSIELIVEPLTHIINASLCEGKIPDIWKRARVTPIHKGGDAANPNNYRPISVLPVLSKVLEKLVFNQVYKYLVENELLCSNQHGFRPKHSTLTALLSITEDFYRKLDDGYVIGIVTLDLEKAFDLISYDILLKKLEYYGFDQNVLCWLKDYFNGREQCTSVNGKMSSTRKVKSGVPQGSILGPLLFIITLNDLHKSVNNCSLSLYADDTCMYFAAKDRKTLEKNINDDLKSISAWFSHNKLLLNVDKCQFMLAGSKHKLSELCNVDIRLNNKKLARVFECKYLGVVLDCNLNWNKEIDHVKKKVLKTFFALKRVRNLIDKKLALILYKTLIQPKFDYCSSVWMNGQMTLLKRLQTLQNRCLRNVLGVNSRFHTDDLYKTLKLDKLKDQWTKQTLIIVFKLLHNAGPSRLSSLITFNVQSNYLLRSSNSQIALPKPRTNFLRNSPLYQASKLFNALPLNVRLIDNTKIFTSEISKMPNIASELSKTMKTGC